MLKLLLVSQSPRRQKILKDAGFFFSVDTVKLSEIIEENVNLRAAIEALAERKGQAYLDEHKHLKSKDILMLTADTVVVLAGQILGKPETRAVAVEYLNNLSGKTHSVITAICLWNLKTDQKVLASSQTLVKFRDLCLSEIEDYVATGEPMDKAGGYGIQGEARKFVEKIEGDFDNVVGLPLKLVQDLILEKGWNVARE